MAQNFEVGDKILCSSSSNLDIFYEAKVLKVGTNADGQNRIFVHYQGWHRRHDEWINEDLYDLRTKIFTEEEHLRQKELIAELKAPKGKNKSRPKQRPSEAAEGREDTPQSQQSEDDKGSTAPSKEPKTAKRPAKRKHEMTVENKDAAAGSKPNELQVHLTIPAPLKNILVEDYNQINKLMKLYTLPSKHTVDSIFQDFFTEMNLAKTDNDEVLVEYDHDQKSKHPTWDVLSSSMGLQDYFNSFFPTQLLYKFERPQFVAFSKKQKIPAAGETTNKKKRSTSAAKETAAEEPKFRSSSVYGLPHLLRLLTRFENQLKVTPYNDRIRNMILSVVCDFTVWLNKNHEKYIGADDYEVASPEYQRDAFV